VLQTFRTLLYQIKLQKQRKTTMAVVEETWQTKRSTIAERTTFIFNNQLLSDVQFVVPLSTDESESIKKAIPAHRFVLAISSPVFYAMFYGQMAETTHSIALPDCDYESLLELFRFMYTDEANLSAVLGEQIYGAFSRREMYRISSRKFGGIQRVLHSATRSEM